MNKKKINATVAAECVPWQKCPICNGTKQVLKNYFHEPMSTDAGTWQPCDTCHGLGIIPMFVFPADVCTKCGQFKIMGVNGIMRQLCTCD